jgi:hypothetical protein
VALVLAADFNGLGMVFQVLRAGAGAGESTFTDYAMDELKK